MSSSWDSTRSSLDDSVALFRASLGNLKAAKAVDIAEVIEQLKRTAESARRMRELVWSELPEASWQGRPELDALVDQIQKSLAAKALEEHLRSRLLALANELERGTIVHRRAHRLQELNHLREQAINELRSQTGLEKAPQPLPGPPADQWIGWACGLQEPQDAESLQALRNGFVHLDDFVANLELNMWGAAESPTPEATPEPQKPAEKVQPEQSRLQTKVFEVPVASSVARPLEATRPARRRDKPRSLSLVEEMPPPAFHSNTLTPNDATPPPTEEHMQETVAQERALLSGMMGIVSDPAGHFDHPVELPFTGELYREARSTSPGPVSDPVATLDQSVESEVAGEGSSQASAASAGIDSDPVSHFNGRVERPFIVERPFDGEVFRETIVAPPGLVSDSDDHFEQPVERPFTAGVFGVTSAASEIFSKVRFELEERWSKQRGMLLAIAAALVVAVLGAILWSSGATLWRSGRNNAGTAPAKAIETKTAELTPSSPVDKGNGQPAIPAASETRASQANAHTKEPSKEQSKEQSKEPSKEQSKQQPKPPEQSTASNPPSKTPPAKPASGHEDEVLRPPASAPRDTTAVKKEKEEAPPNVTAEMAGSIPGGLPSGASNSVANIVKNVPVAVPKAAVEKVGISSGVAQGLLIHQVTPQYPSQARQARIQGTVVLQVVIGKDGSVQNLHVISGHPMLNQAAMDAVKKWRYKPYRLNGEPVEADTQINVNFNLSGE